MWRYVQRRRTAMQAARSEHLHTQSLLNQQHDIWDVIIVGSGPAGATCAYYCAVEGLRVLLLDRDRFPRDKICGDQVHTQAQHILKDMGVLQQLLTDDVVKWVCITPKSYGCLLHDTFINACGYDMSRQ
jgi:ribulose 1,5-bisphosphate synthetase/thiazole synthase